MIDKVLKKIAKVVLCLLMVISVFPSLEIGAANTAKKDGQSERYVSGQYYHIDVLVEAEYRYTLTFEKNNVEADHADINVVKTWNVASNETIPSEVVVEVMAVSDSGTTLAGKVTLTASTNWEATLENMPLYDANGNKIKYEVYEDGVSAEGYYETIVTEIESTVDTNNTDVLVYNEDGKTLTFYFDNTAPHINVNGVAYPASTANWVSNSDGTYSLTFHYTNETDTSLDYVSTWVYNPTAQTYTYISDDYMVVDGINYVTYTDLVGAEKILYDMDEYVTSTNVTTRNENDINVARDYYNYIEQADSYRADQEFWSTNRAIEDMPAGTTIRVGYDYTYGYFDKFGAWHSYSATAERVFDTSTSEFINVCDKSNAIDTQKGYDVVLQLSDDDAYFGDGLKEIYNVAITNTPTSSLSINKTVANVNDMPDADQEFTFTITLDEFLGTTIDDTFELIIGEKTSAITFVNGVATVSLKQGETATINGLPKGVDYVISESVPTDYIVEDNNIKGTIDGSTVEFVNTYNNPTGNLVVMKEVSHPYGTSYTMPDKAYEITVSLGSTFANKTLDIKDENGTKTTITTNASGAFTVSLKDGEYITIYDLPKGTTATVSEKEYAGFTTKFYPSNTATITGSEHEIVVENEYTPEELEVVINISGTKTVTGNWTDEEFTFYLQKYVDGSWETIATDTANKTDSSIDFMSEDLLNFTTIGKYEYRVIEENSGKVISGVVYDNTVHTFEVIVTDVDLDGEMEAQIVSTHETENGFTFNTTNNTWENNHINFTNEINKGKTGFTLKIQKNVTNLSGSTLVDKEGFIFELYEADSDYVITNNTSIYTSDDSGLSGETDVHVEYEFDENKVNEPYTYYYVLKEKASNITNMKDDTTVYNIKVVVTHNNDGTVTRELHVYNQNGVEVTTTITEGNTVYPIVTFTNVYEPTPTSHAFSLIKKLSGRDLEDGEFTFEVYEVLTYDATSGNMTVTEQPVRVATNVGANVTFDAIEYTKVGTHYYKIVEKVPEGATLNDDETYTYKGVTYDISVYYVRVNVADVNGSLQAAQTILNSTSIIFNNTYNAAAVGFGITMNKIIVDSTVHKDRNLVAGEFNFEFIQVDANGKQVVGGYHLTSSNDADGNIDFSGIEFEEEGTYYFIAKEQSGTLGGITYDTTMYKYEVVVKDNLEGKLVVASTKIYISTDGGNTYTVYDGTSGTFANVYDAKPVTLPVYGIKVLNGRELNAEEFTFVIRESDASGTVIENGYKETVKNAADGSFQFKAITFDTEGIYYYVISEDDGSLGGITYDTTKYLLKVKINDDGEGNLVATPTLSYVNETGTPARIAFTNTYTTTPATVNFTATKKLTGKTLTNEQFAFHLAKYENVTHTLVQEVKNDENGNVTFDSITFDTEGTYTYIVHEVGGGTNKDGISYDATTYTYVIKVVDNGEGEMVAYLVEGTTETEITSALNSEFENEYATNSVKETLTISKTLTKDGEIIDFGNREFTFNLTLKSAPEKTSHTVGNVEKLTISENGMASFDTLTFHDNKDEGEFIFEISEVKGSLGGITYDESVYTVVITVSDNGHGELETSTVIKKGETIIASSDTTPYNPELTVMTFENVYKVAKTSVSVEAEKELYGKVLEAGLYEFMLAGPAGTYTATNDATGNIVFKDIEFTSEGVYEYIMSEVNGSLRNVEYDGHTYDVIITVTDNNEGKLVAKVEYKTYTEDVPVFENTYHAPKLEIKKAQTLNDGTPTTDTLLVEEDDVVTYYLTVTNKSEGDATNVIVTDAIPTGLTLVSGSISDGGTNVNETITWSIENLAAGESKMVSFKVDVPNVKEYTQWKNIGKVSYEDPGTLEDDPKEEPSNEVIIEQSAAAHVTIAGKKNLTGRTLKAEEFTFELWAADEMFVIGNVIEKVTNDVEGNFNFSELEFDKVGTHHYVVKEYKGDGTGVEYDENTYQIKIEVKDDGNGSLYPVITIDGDEVDTDIGITFNNKFTAESIEVDLAFIQKVLKNKSNQEMSLEGFVFKLESEHEEPVVAISDAEGKAQFALTFRDEDAGKTFTFKLCEVDSGMEHMTYDSASYIITVKVTKDNNGVLHAEMMMDEEEIEVANVTFTNTYNPPKSVDTGDHSSIAIYLALSMSSLLALLYIMLAKKRHIKN